MWYTKELVLISKNLVEELKTIVLRVDFAYAQLTWNLVL